ncbi:hypothetical protein Q765_03525 [Flavobacterium rivuli WB 3.3-2 = DSM 21788]|uniref:Uncharacterized protein n=1 Tax=Flavobacterium rivuli WB 3.3-2 = DSM 21788 TaxID=1121895 RepID=A0A0A2M926_9FLAO|nr:hypothetical protein Q765_03525 [Flavobacterium rivuli WB 3.3-2 = DSM 21788]
MSRFFKLITAISLLTLAFINFVPVSKRLLNMAPAALGWAEFIVLVSHAVLGLSTYIFFYLLKDILKINLVLVVTAICLSCIDYPVYNYNKCSLTLGLILVRVVESFIAYKLYRSNTIKNTTGIIVSILLFLVLVAFYFVMRKF